MDDRQSQVEAALARVTLPYSASIRAWREPDFAIIQWLSNAEGWPTPRRRPEDALAAWRNSWPALVALEGENIIGFLRALSDGAVTMYIAEVLIDRR